MQGIYEKLKPIPTYFITPPINTELTESDESNQVSDANIQAHVVLEPEVSNEQTANEGFDANILHAPSDEHIMRDLMQAFCKLPLKDLVSNDDMLC